MLAYHKWTVKIPKSKLYNAIIQKIIQKQTRVFLAAAVWGGHICIEGAMGASILDDIMHD